MAEDSGKITTEAEDVQEKEEEGEKKLLNIEPSPPLPETPAPKKRAAKKSTLVEIPVDAPAPAPTKGAGIPVDVPRERATSSAPAAKARGRPKGAVGAAKRAPPAEVAAPPPTPREEYSLEDHMTLMLRHTRQMQEARRTAVRDKYRNWVR